MTFPIPGSCARCRSAWLGSGTTGPASSRHRSRIAELTDLACHTLVLLGDRETIYDPYEAARRATALIPDCDVEVVPGVGHLLGMQRPDLVNARLDAFL